MDRASLKKPATKKELGLGVMIIIGLFVAFMRVVYLPRSEQLKPMAEEIKKMKLEKDALVKFQKASQANKKKSQPVQTTDTKPRLQILSGTRKPIVAEASDLMSLLTLPFYLKGLVLDSVNQNASTVGTGYLKTPFAISVHGPYLKIISFIENLDNLDALVTLDEFVLGLDDMQVGVVNFQLSGTFYEQGNYVVKDTSKSKDKDKKKKDKSDKATK